METNSQGKFVKKLEIWKTSNDNHSCEHCGTNKLFVDLPVITEYLSHSIFQSLSTSELPSPWKLTSLISHEKDVSTCVPQHFAFKKGSLGLVDHTDWMYLPSGQTLSQDVSPICLTFWTILNSPITLQG